MVRETMTGGPGGWAGAGAGGFDAWGTGGFTAGASGFAGAPGPLPSLGGFVKTLIDEGPRYQSIEREDLKVEEATSIHVHILTSGRDLRAMTRRVVVARGGFGGARRRWET